MKTIGNFSIHPSADVNIFSDEHYKLYQKRHKLQPAKLIIELLPNIEELKKSKEPHYVFIDGKTGCGKSTYFITQLFKHYQKKVIVLEPRINLTSLNAKSICRKTEFNNDPVPEDRVGWKNSVESQKPKYKESVMYVTTQIMNNYILNEDSFKDTIIVVDEVHQLDMPMITMLWNLKKNQHKFGLVLMMSATANFKRLAKYFDVDLKNPYHYFGVLGRSQFDVKVDYLLDTNPELTSLHDIGVYIGEYIKKEISKCKSDNPYPNIDLAYILPVKSMFKEVEEGIREVIKPNNKLKYKVLLIKYSSDVVKQNTVSPVFAKLPNTVKIILTTPAIEIGQTIFGLKTIVDSGLVYKSYYCPLQIQQHSRHSGEIQAISKATQTQRFGRVGRNMNGVILCVYTKEASDSLLEEDPPENLSIPSMYWLEENVMTNDVKHKSLTQSEFEKYSIWFDFGRNLIEKNSLATTIRTITDLLASEHSQSKLPQTIINGLNNGENIYEIMFKHDSTHTELLKSSIDTTYKPGTIANVTTKRIKEVIAQVTELLKLVE